MKYILLALMTGLCWGFYGPTLANARLGLQSPFKPYVMIGIAYLLLAVLGGIIGMKLKGDNFNFEGPGVTWGFVAGALGALGALFLTFSMLSGGGKHPHIVMAVVFGSAVSIAAIVGWIQTRHELINKPVMWLGVILTVIGILMTALNTPHPKPSAKQHQKVTLVH